MSESSALAGIPEASALPALDARQRELVRKNLGLVAVHLRRGVPGLSGQRLKQRWDDLFQEGCLGLICAAAYYRPDAGIPFASFALSRIRYAVSRALTTQGQSAGPFVDDARLLSVSTRTRGMPRTVVHAAPPPPREPDEPEQPGVETVGERLRARYARAVERAGWTIGSTGRRRDDRRKLVGILIQERLLIPDEASRVTYREIARQSGSSYARVRQCEHQLIRMVRGALEADPELPELGRLIRTDPRGPDLVIDEHRGRVLAAAAAESVIRRFRAADHAARNRLLSRLDVQVDPALEQLLRERLLRLDPRSRDRLVDDVPTRRSRAEKSDPCGRARSRRGHRRRWPPNRRHRHELRHRQTGSVSRSVSPARHSSSPVD